MWPVYGQPRAVALLQRSLSEGRIAHAYLLTGPPKTGKATLAKVFAQALSCQADDPPCGDCRLCRGVAAETHPDVRVLRAGVGDGDSSEDEDGEPGKSRRTIGIGRILGLQHDAALLPYEARWKVYIIDGAESLSLPAANSLLKTLEEPPGSVVLILTAVDAKILPSTIVSRCQEIALGLTSFEAIQELLQEKWNVETEQARLLSHLSGGRIGWAIEAVEGEMLADREATLGNIANLARSSRSERFAYAEKLATQFGREVEAARSALDLWQSWWRDLLLVGAGCPDLVINVDRAGELAQQARRYTVDQLFGFILALEEARDQLEKNVNARLALEALMLRMPRPAR
ncbi:MAG: DNA polymerase III subunit delta' [Chloroflexi bacterium]|nr:DNA polymerase III subunit delta' [Chloroflexota bacterium]